MLSYMSIRKNKQRFVDRLNAFTMSIKKSTKVTQQGSSKHAVVPASMEYVITKNEHIRKQK